MRAWCLSDSYRFQANGDRDLCCISEKLEILLHRIEGFHWNGLISVIQLLDLKMGTSRVASQLS